MTGELDVDDATRRQLEYRCRSRKSRRNKFSSDMPTHWDPGSLRDPRAPDEFFSTDTAWEFIADHIKNGCEIEIILLEKPPGKRGYVLKLAGHPDSVVIYVKLQLGADCVFGRSFHISTP